MEMLYTTIGEVESVIVDRYRMYGTRISFVNALEFLLGAGKLTTRRPKFPTSFDFLSDDAFAKFINSVPVYATQILEDIANQIVITERQTIPENRDIFFIKHIPYVYEALHAHTYFEINYMYSKSCIQFFENEQRVLNEGDLCIIPPYARHNIIAEPGALVLGILVRQSTFDRIFWRLLTQKDLLSTFFRHSLYEKENPSNYLFLHTDNRSELKYMVQNLALECSVIDSYANSCAISLLNVFFGRMLRTYGRTIEFYNAESTLRREFDFSLLLHYIQNNYRTVTLQSLASVFHYSQAYLSRRIKDGLGKSFIEIIQDLKMNRAAESLGSTNMKIHEIAELVGYDSVDHFSRTFKKVYGVPPLTYRKNSTETAQEKTGRDL